MAEQYGVSHMPDVLTCLADLSNDEVFTPPDVANAMLDLLPEDIWRRRDVKFLDPCCKTGVFLREITKRLLRGQMPDFDEQMSEIEKKRQKHEELDDIEEAYLGLLQAKLNHILKNQVYGIAITQLTALITRRTLYCAKNASKEFSVVEFDNPDGNIRYVRTDHVWTGKEGQEHCLYCRASKKEIENRTSNETHAYELIHTTDIERLFKLEFDVVIGNPPYQLNDGGNNASAVPIYNKFVEQALKLNPRYLLMIIPSRWYCGGRGLESFRKLMLSSGKVRELHDYKNSSDCFDGIRNGGGICYFLWDSSYDSKISRIAEHDATGVVRETNRSLDEFGEIFIRDSICCEIIRKVRVLEEETLSNIVYRQKPFGFRTNFVDFDTDGTIKIYSKKAKGGYAYIKRDKVKVNADLIDKWKLVTSRSTSVPEEDNGQVLRLSQTFIAEPGSVVTESYVLVATFDDEETANNAYSYLKTRFFRFLCQPTIVSPDVSKRTFVFVPIQDFSKPWSDAELYKKYNLTQEEINFIDSMIKPVELGDNDDQ